MACMSVRPLLLGGGLIILVTAFLPAAIQARSGGQKHFVLVHGLAHGAWCWYKTITLLQKAGHRTTAIDLTSNGISKAVADNVTSIAQFCQPLTQFLANEVQTPNKVILVGHSLGGSAISYAMELYPEKIEKAIFLAAIMPSNNQTYIPSVLLAVLQQYTQEGYFVQNFANGPSMPPTSVNVNLSLVRELFYNESPLQDVNLAKALLNPTPAIPLFQVLSLTPAKYGSIKRFYIKTGRDRTIPPAIQANITQNNPPNEVFFIPTSDHSVFFSRPIILNGLLLSIANRN